MDFCTIAKISVIVLDEKYHGYYVSLDLLQYLYCMLW